MKKFFVLIFISQSIFAQQKPQLAFSITEKDLIPEGIAYDPVEKNFYVSSIHKRKIIKISEKGIVSDLVKTNQDEIKEVLGMRVDAFGKLWACNNTPDRDSINKISNVHVYDLKTRKLFKHHRLNDGKRHLFNDLHFTSSGDTYITDSEGGTIYVIRKGSETMEELIPSGSLHYPNGITGSTDEKKLFVSTGSGQGIVSIDLQSKEIKPVKHPKFLIISIDGLYRYKNKLIGIQNSFFPEAIVQFELAADAKSIDKMEFLASNDQKFDLPTTGVIVGDDFYFIANSQMLQIIGEHGNIKNPEKLNDTLIMKIKLN